MFSTLLSLAVCCGLLATVVAGQSLAWRACQSACSAKLLQFDMACEGSPQCTLSIEDTEGIAACQANCEKQHKVLSESCRSRCPAPYAEADEKTLLDALGHFGSTEVAAAPAATPALPTFKQCLDKCQSDYLTCSDLTVNDYAAGMACNEERMDCMLWCDKHSKGTQVQTQPVAAPVSAPVRSVRAESSTPLISSVAVAETPMEKIVAEAIAECKSSCRRTEAECQSEIFTFKSTCADRRQFCESKCYSDPWLSSDLHSASRPSASVADANRMLPCEAECSFAYTQCVTSCPFAHPPCMDACVDTRTACVEQCPNQKKQVARISVASPFVPVAQCEATCRLNYYDVTRRGACLALCGKSHEQTRAQSLRRRLEKFVRV